MKKLLISVVIGLCLVALTMVVSYSISQHKLKTLTPETRAGLHGDFIKLEDGVISYYWKGSEDGDVVVLVHGLSTPKFVWDGNVDALTAAGHRVLVFDHFSSLWKIDRSQSDSC